MQRLKAYIYRYVDVIEEEVVYVGIVYAGHSLRTRINKELRTFDWINDRVFRIEYQMLELSQTDLQALEAHLINKYRPVYNIQKTNWGSSQFIDIDETKWEDYEYRDVKEVQELKRKILTLEEENKRLRESIDKIFKRGLV